MKLSFTYLLLFSSACSIMSISPALAQGDLTPPGAPAPTMKTLDQIEARTPISILPYTIDSSGSYYLTNNISTDGDGIIISSNNVSLDLNGFTISGSNTGSSVIEGILLSLIHI